MAVAYDATGAGGGTGTSTTATWTHVLGASATDIVVVVGCETDGATVTAKVGTTAMTSLGKVHNNNQTSGFTQVFGLTTPPTGSQTITITRSASSPGVAFLGNSMSFTGSAGYGAVATNFGSGTSDSVSITTTTSGNMAVAGYSYGTAGGESTTTGTLQFHDSQLGNNAAQAASGITEASTGSSMTLTLTVSTADWWGAVGFEVKAGGATSHNQTAAATATSTSGLVRQIGRILKLTGTSTGTTLTGQARFQTVLASVTSTGAASFIKVKILAALASVLSGPTIKRQISKGVPSTPSSAADLDMVITLHLTGASVTTTATVSAIKARFLNAVASVTSAASLVRQIARHLTVNPSATPTLVRGLSTTVKASTASTASLLRQIARRVTATSTSSTSLSAIKAHLLTILANATSTSQALRFLAKVALATATSSSRLTRALSSHFVATATSTPTILRSLARTITASVTSTASAIANRGTQTFNLTVRALAGTVGTLGAIKVKVVNVLASATSSSTLVRQIGKMATATPATTVVLFRRIAKTAAAAVASLVSALTGSTHSKAKVTSVLSVKTTVTSTLSRGTDVSSTLS